MKYCNICHQPLDSDYKIYRGKNICNACYNKKVKKSSNNAEERNKLYTFLKEFFNLTEIPDGWVYQISKMIEEGKTCYGIARSIHYAYVVLDQPINYEFGLGIVYVKYNESEQYYAKQAQIKKINEDIEIINNINKVKISKPKKTQRKPSYNIEDL